MARLASFGPASGEDRSREADTSRATWTLYPDGFSAERIIEVIETEEVPVVGKRARLREELVVRTERTQRVETVQETVRRDEVEIHQPNKKLTARQRANS